MKEAAVGLFIAMTILFSSILLLEATGFMVHVLSDLNGINRCDATGSCGTR